MKYKNKHNLPQALADVIQKRDEHYQRLGDISVTELIGPPIVSVLRKEFAEELTADVSDQVWALLGSSVHDAVAKYASSGNLDMCEIPVAVEYDGDGNKMVLSGTFDMLDRENILNDFKVTSIYAFLLGDKPEWEAQLNVYARLAELSGIGKPTALRIIAILKDWTPYQARMDERCPKCPVQVKDIPMWSTEMVDAFIAQRLQYHYMANVMARDNGVDSVPICTKSERWQGETRYAVYKGANIKATKVLDSEDAATDFIAQQKAGEYRIEVRAGMPRRCQDYCDVCAFCPFGKRLIENPDSVPSEHGISQWAYEYNAVLMEA